MDRLRSSLGMTIEELAARADLNKNTVNRIVRGVGRPHLETFFKLCTALHVSPNELISTEPESESYRVIRRFNHTDRRMEDRGDGMRLGFLQEKLPGGALNCAVIEISSKGRMQSHPGEELLYCVSGKIGIQLGDMTEHLSETDAILFYGTESHRYFNAHQTDDVSVALCIWTSAAIEPNNFGH